MNEEAKSERRALLKRAALAAAIGGVSAVPVVPYLVGPALEDPHRAAPLFSRQIKPYLIDEATGARLGVPSPRRTGPLRSLNPPQADRTYFMFFSNFGRLVRPGSAVTIVIGDFRLKTVVDQ